MKTDDPRLEESLTKIREQVAKYDNTILTVLKGHLGLEQQLNDYLDAKNEECDELTFYEKYELCKELKPAVVDDGIWEMMRAGNELRNKIAHLAGDQVRAEKIKKLREAYEAVVTPAQAEGLKKLDELVAVAEAFNTCSSFLMVAAANARQGQ